jgi:hypothetical protein
MMFCSYSRFSSNGHDFIDTILNLELKLSFVIYPENLEKVTYVKVADTNEASFYGG